MSPELKNKIDHHPGSDLFNYSAFKFRWFLSQDFDPKMSEVGSTDIGQRKSQSWCQIFGNWPWLPLPNSLLKPAFLSRLYPMGCWWVPISWYIFHRYLVGTIPWFYTLASSFHSEIRPGSQQTQAGPAGKHGDFVWQLRWGFDANVRVMYQWMKGLKQQTCGFIDRSEAFTNKNRDFAIHVGLCFFSFVFHLAWHWIQRKPTSDLCDLTPIALLVCVTFMWLGSSPNMKPFRRSWTW